MAAKEHGSATGAAPDGQDLRRRNVPGTEGTNGSVVKSPEPDNKKIQKVRGCSVVTCMVTLLTMSVDPNFICLDIRRIRIFNSPDYIYSPGLLYSNVEDWSI